MIDVPLREQQFDRVLGFLDEQLGDSDVTIVFGDAEGDRAYFVSNGQLQGYQKHGGIYVKDAGRPEEWDRNAREGVVNSVDWDPKYYGMESRFTETKNGKKKATITKTTPIPSEIYILGVTVPYAWNYSAAFRDLISPRHQPEHLRFPDDHTTCHEAAHGIIKPHSGFLAAYDSEPVIEGVVDSMNFRHDPEDTREYLLNEALAQLISANYTDRYHTTEDANRLRGFWSVFETDQEHMQAVRLVFNQHQAMEKLRERIRERNLARKL